MSNKKTDNNPIFLVIGVFLILVALFLISDFFLAKTYVDAWTAKWTISVFFIVTLSVIGLGFIYESRMAVNGIYLVCGLIYSFLSIVVYGYFGYSQAIGLHDFWGFVGFTIFFVVIALIGFSCIPPSNISRLFKLLSYGYLFSNLALVMFLVDKYVLEEAHFNFWVFAGEMFIVIGGAIIFLVLHNAD